LVDPQTVNLEFVTPEPQCPIKPCCHEGSSGRRHDPGSEPEGFVYNEPDEALTIPLPGFDPQLAAAPRHKRSNRRGTSHARHPHEPLVYDAAIIGARNVTESVVQGVLDVSFGNILGCSGQPDLDGGPAIQGKGLQT
jgi:hypothetical protein